MELRRCRREPFWSILFYYACDGGAADAESLGDLAERSAVSAMTKDGSPVEIECGAADVPPLQACTTHAGTNPFDDQRPLQLGDHRDNDDDSATKRATGVEVLAE